MNPEQVKTLVQWLFGLGAASVFLAMAWATLEPDVVLSIPVIMGMLGLIYMLLYGADQTTKLLAVWRKSSLSGDNGGGDDH